MDTFTRSYLRGDRRRYHTLQALCTCNRKKALSEQHSVSASDCGHGFFIPSSACHNIAFEQERSHVCDLELWLTFRNYSSCLGNWLATLDKQTGLF